MEAAPPTQAQEGQPQNPSSQSQNPSSKKTPNGRVRSSPSSASLESLTPKSDREARSRSREPTLPADAEAAIAQQVEVFLREVRLFRTLPSSELQSLSKELTVEDFASESCIIKKGESGDSMYIVWTGHAHVCSEDDTSKILRQYRPGDWFGEMTLLESEPSVRKATIQCEVPTRVLRLARPSFENMSRSSRTAITMMAQLLYADTGRSSWKQYAGAVSQLLLRIVYAILFWPLATVWFFDGSDMALAVHSMLGYDRSSQAATFLVLSSLALLSLQELLQISRTGPECVAQLLHFQRVPPWKVSLVEKTAEPLDRIGKLSMVCITVNVIFHIIEMLAEQQGLSEVLFFDMKFAALIESALHGIRCVWFAFSSSNLASYVLLIKDPPTRIVNEERSEIGSWSYTVEQYYLALQDPRAFGDDFVADLAGAVNRIVAAVTVFLAVIPWLWLFGCQPTQVVTLGGFGTVAFGFASKEVLENLVSGILLNLSKPFVRGDRLKTEDAKFKGVVRKVGIAYSQINTDDGETLMVPNSVMLKKATVNMTRRRFRLIQATFWVILADFRQLGDLCKELKEVMLNHPEVISGAKFTEMRKQDPQLRIFEPQCTFEGIGERGAELTFLAYTENIRDPRFMQIRSEVLLQINEKILDFGGSFAFKDVEVITKVQE